MRYLTVLVTLLFCAAVWANDVLLIENVTIVSPHLKANQQNSHVLIVDGRIQTIRSSKISPPSQATIVDGSDQFLAPGIMDSHVHVSSVPGMGFASEPVSRQRPKLVESYFIQQPRSFLYHGVTQVLDPNPGLHWKKFTDSPQHPDFFRCEVITSENTFPLVEKIDEESKSLFKYLVNEDAKHNAPNSPEVLVEAIQKSGASCIKLYFEDGYGDASHWPLLSKSTLRRIRQAAKKFDLPVLAHANAFDMYQRALQLGVDVIVHGLWNWGEYARSGTIPKPRTDMLDQLMTKNMGYMPTQRVIAGLGELMLPDISNTPSFVPVTPKALLAWYKKPAANWFKDELRVGFDQLPDRIIASIFLDDRVTKGSKIMKYLSDANYPLLLGSDFPGSPSYANQPGLTTYLEMKMMAESGLTPAEILAAATINNAKKFSLDDSYGTIEEGKVANLLLLREDPLSSVESWNSISFVILNGKLIERQSLAAN